MTHPYQDPTLSTSQRVADLLSRMTLEEKVAQLHHIWKQDPTEGSMDKTILKTYGETGLGAAYVFWVEDLNALQKHMIENSRLGIPVSFVTEALHGGSNDGTIFPMPLAMASSWNRDLMHRVHTHIAKEARISGANQSMSPNVDVAVEPRFGRVDEGYGEDPFLSSEFAAASIRGLQGEGDQVGPEHIAATVKHFAAYGNAEGGQDGGSADLSEQTLREIHLPPFKAAVEAGSKALMPAHHEVNGVPCHANAWLLRKILREEWGFKGMVVSDAGDVNILCAFGLATDYDDAGVQGIEAGVDQELYVSAYANLQRSVEEGKLDSALIDEAVARVLGLKFECGLFEHPYSDPSRKAELDSPEGRQLAYQASAEGVVLLKNEEDFLPLDVKKLKKVALIGPNIDNEDNQVGLYTRKGAHVVTLKEGLENRLPEGCEVRTANGCEIMDDSEEGLEEAVALAKWADVVVLALGDSLDSCRECYGSRPGDRTDLCLSGGQERLWKEVFAVNPNTVMVLINGRPQAICEANEKLPAIVEAWRCGEEGGHVVADVLLGTVNPSGHLTMTFPRSVGQLPMYYHRKERGFKKRLYTFESPEPLYPFGFGLSYTRFEWTEFEVTPQVTDKAGTVTVKVTVTNSGSVAGADVVQLYMRDPVASMTRPMRKLVGFERIALEPGEIGVVELSVAVEQFGYVDRNCQFVIDEGAIELIVARHAKDEAFKAEITVGKEMDVDARAVVESDRMLIPD